MSAPVTFAPVTRLESPTFTACGLTWQWLIASQAWRTTGRDFHLHVYRVWRGVYQACDGTRFGTPEEAARHGVAVTFGGGEAA